MNIGTNLSSINAHQELLNASSHNIANSNTRKFERTQTTIQENGTDSVKATFQKEANKNPYSNTDLIKEISDQIISYNMIGANSVAIKTKNEAEQALLDIYA